MLAISYQRQATDNNSACRATFRVAAAPGASYGLRRIPFVKLLALITGTCMLLGTYALTALRRRVGGMLDRWGRDPVDRWSPALPSSSK